MIRRFSIDARALEVEPEDGLRARVQNKRLAECIREYGSIKVLGVRDAEELRTAMRSQSNALGYDFWRPLMVALSSSGFDADSRGAHDSASTRESCERGQFDRLEQATDVVVVDGASASTAGLTDYEAFALYETEGHTRHGSRLELAVAGAVDQTETVQWLRRLRSETIIPAGTHRDDVWSEYLGALAQSSSEVNIYDKFLFSGLIHRENNQPSTEYLNWLLRNLDRALPRRASINLYALTGRRVARDNRDPSARPYTTGTIAKAIRGLKGFDRDGRLRVVLWDGLDHDRHIRFSSGHALMAQAGFDHLKFDPGSGTLTNPFSYAYVARGYSLDERARLEVQARESARAQVYELIGDQFVQTAAW